MTSTHAAPSRNALASGRRHRLGSRVASQPTPHLSLARRFEGVRINDSRAGACHKPLHRILVALLLLVTVAVSPGQDVELLQTELSALLSKGKIDSAVQRAQEALARHPNNDGIRREFADLHVSLARTWMNDRRFADARLAIDAALKAAPDHAGARSTRATFDELARRAGQRAAQIPVLLRLELFDAALDEINEIRQLRPDLVDALDGYGTSAWLGAADDHYLARNFNEAFVLYERYLAAEPRPPHDACTRWAISLALALSEAGTPSKSESRSAGRLLARAIDVLKNTNEPVLGKVIGGLLAERAGQPIDAGRTYCEAIGEAWVLPAADQRRFAIARLRARAIEAVRRVYEDTPTRRREGLWSAALSDVWKSREGLRFNVWARSELVAQRVHEALEHHYAHLRRWLHLDDAADWRPTCDVRVHESLERLHAETGTSGSTRAVSRTRLADGRVTARSISVFQSDPWLLSSTLPHELTHLLLADAMNVQAAEPDTRQPATPRAARRITPPLALDEGLAVQSEPPARRLLYRRLLKAPAPLVSEILAADRFEGDQSEFYSRCDALAEFMLARVGTAGVIRFCAENERDRPWRGLGFEDARELTDAWKVWYSKRAAPPRMPLMILTPPAAEQRQP